jgi:glyoxylase-like metal-dependent hydrolase (beta-lactamase superfamily II)
MLDLTMVERIIVGPMNTNAYVFGTAKKECLLVDPGGDGAVIIQRLEAMNIAPTGIVCTHGHLDHISAIQVIRDYYAGRGITVSVAIHAEDAKYLGSGAEATHRESFYFLGNGADEIFPNVFPALPEPDVLIEDGDTVLDSDLVAMHTPGHTPGSICLFSEGQEALFSGDTLFFEGTGRTDLPGGSQDELLDSVLKRLFLLPPTTRVFPGHGPLTTLEREIRHNPIALA